MPDLHKIMPYYSFNNLNLDRSKKFQNTIDNPHIVDWYFFWRLNQFLKKISITYLIMNGVGIDMNDSLAIHAHRTARLNTDPGLIELAAKVYIGRFIN